MNVESFRERWGFPLAVNAMAARLVGGMVATTAVLVIATGWYALVPLMALGFLLRVLSGPKLSPFALLATRVLIPRLRLAVIPVPGAPKRFAQAVGLIFTSTASWLALVGGHVDAARALLAVLTVFAALEATLEICAGCIVYERLVRWGIAPPPPDVTALETT